MAFETRIKELEAELEALQRELEKMKQWYCDQRDARQELQKEIERLKVQRDALQVEYNKQPEWTKRFLEQQGEIDKLRTENAELREVLRKVAVYLEPGGAGQYAEQLYQDVQKALAAQIGTDCFYRTEDGIKALAQPKDSNAT